MQAKHMSGSDKAEGNLAGYGIRASVVVVAVVVVCEAAPGVAALCPGNAARVLNVLILQERQRPQQPARAAPGAPPRPRACACGGGALRQPPGRRPQRSCRAGPQ